MCAHGGRGWGTVAVEGPGLISYKKKLKRQCVILGTGEQTVNWGEDEK